MKSMEAQIGWLCMIFIFAMVCSQTGRSPLFLIASTKEHGCIENTTYDHVTRKGYLKY